MSMWSQKEIVLRPKEKRKNTIPPDTLWPLHHENNKPVVCIVYIIDRSDLQMNINLDS